MNQNAITLVLRVLLSLISMGLIRLPPDGEEEGTTNPEPAKPARKAAPKPAPTPNPEPIQAGEWEEVPDGTVTAAEMEEDGETLWTDAAAADQSRAVPTVCGSGKTKGCGGTFMRAPGDGKTCPGCKSRKAAKRAKAKASKGAKAKPAPQPKAQPAPTPTPQAPQADAATMALLQALLAQAGATVQAPQPQAEEPEPTEPLADQTRVCSECGVDYHPRNWNQKRCGKPECTRAANAARMRLRTAAAKTAGWLTLAALASMA